MASKIGIILDNEYTIDIRVSNEAKYLTLIGHDVHVLCPNYSNQKGFEIIEGVSVHRFKLNKSIKNKLFGLMNLFPFYEWFWIRQIKRFVRDVNPQILHANDLYMAKSAYYGGGGISIVLDLHENFPAAILSYKWSSKFPHRLLSRPRLWQRKEFKYLSYARKIVVLSNSFKETLVKRYPKLNSTDIFVYPNVPDVRVMLSYPIKEGILSRNNQFVLFYFGGISIRRGISTCFEAIKLLNSKIPSIHLLLIGPVDGHEQAIFNNYLNDPILKERVTHFPWKDISEFPSYVKASNVCLSPIFKNDQHESGVANKIFQYMLFERPLIVSDCAPQIEIVNGANCGLVFSSNDAIDLAQKIEYLFQNPSLCQEMGIAGRKAVINKYNIETCGEELKNLYSSFQAS